MDPIDFEAAFKALCGMTKPGEGPFPWQTALYKRFAAGDIPHSCNLPTGLGKTSVIAVWLIALANGAKVPRRLVYVVNRRTVVDQTTAEVEKYQRSLRVVGPPLPPPLSDLAQRLAERSATPGSPLAISTLRGQFADNREWSADPSRPAVICGTVDMIGSRLLFSGYGCGFRTRPLHAGFLGQDALVVHDEAHLEPAFQELLLAIEKEQRRCNDFRPLRVMELTATSRAGGAAFPNDDERKANEGHPEVRRRVTARKKLHLHENKDEKKLAEELTAIALDCGERSPGSAILVFVRSVEDVGKITKKLPPGSFEQLTGTLRGLERDGLVKKPIFQRFLPKNQEKNGTAYLVCTSAGEVGVNISADHLVCDLTTFDSMAQRFGRVNRFGLRDDTEVHVVHPKEADWDDNEIDARRQRTLVLLEALNGDASPATLGALDPTARQAAFAPAPTILPTSDILFDAWALTSVREKLPGRPPVEPYLHGVGGPELPETHVAWREEVERIPGELLERYPPKDLLDGYPLKPHELLRDNSGRVFDRLKKLKADRAKPVWLLDDDDTVQETTLGDLIDAGKEGIERKTVLLPPSAGGLSKGFLTAESTEADDVSGGEFYRNNRGQDRRVRVWDDDPVPDGMRCVCALDLRPDADESAEEPDPESDSDAPAKERRFWRWYELRDGADDVGLQNSKKPVPWQTHTNDVVERAGGIAGRLSDALGDLRDLIVVAAECHDLGKRRALFQAVLGNREYPRVVLAKSGAKGGQVEERYRHEFGSLLDAPSHPGFAALSDDLKEFVLHLIAAHHGRGRPHFASDEAFDPERPDADAAKVAREVPRRFARIQRKYGRWGLAYLESLLRAADYAASANPTEPKEGQ